jgi:hypothetical protein
LNRRNFGGVLAGSLTVLTGRVFGDVVPTKKILTPNRDWYNLYEEKPTDIGQHLSIKIHEIFESYFDAMTHINKKAALLVYDAADFFIKDYTDIVKVDFDSDVYKFHPNKTFVPNIILHDIGDEHLKNVVQVDYKNVGLERHEWEYLGKGKWKNRDKIAENRYLRFQISDKTELTRQGSIEYSGNAKWKVNMKLDILNPDVRLEWHSHDTNL